MGHEGRAKRNMRSVGRRTTRRGQSTWREAEERKGKGGKYALCAGHETTVKPRRRVLGLGSWKLKARASRNYNISFGLAAGKECSCVGNTIIAGNRWGFDVSKVCENMI